MPEIFFSAGQEATRAGQETSPSILWIAEDGILVKPTVHFVGFLIVFFFFGFIFNDVCCYNVFPSFATALTSGLCRTVTF